MCKEWGPLVLVTTGSSMSWIIILTGKSNLLCLTWCSRVAREGKSIGVLGPSVTSVTPVRGVWPMFKCFFHVIFRIFSFIFCNSFSSFIYFTIQLRRGLYVKLGELD